MKRSDRWLCMLGCVAVLLTLGGIAAGFMGVETVGLMQVGAMQVSTVGGPSGSDCAGAWQARSW